MMLTGALVQLTATTLALLGIVFAARAFAKNDKAQEKKAALESLTFSARPVRAFTLSEISDVQVAFFTLITGGFVLFSALANFQIPDVPEGYAALLGISNAVYVGTKFIRPAPSPGTTASNQ